MSRLTTSQRALFFLPFIVLSLNVAGCGGVGEQEGTEIRIGSLTIQAELARTPEERAQGLSGRDSLPEGEGMLFIFQQEGLPSFWMKGMRFPLDFIWISRDLRVVDITENVPPPGPDGALPTYEPDAAVLYMLEVNAGVVRMTGIDVGDTVAFEPDISRSAEVNLFSNPSFEEGAAPWLSLETAAWGTPFSVSTARAISGASSALLELRSSDEGAGPARVYGIVQEITPEAFPELLSGYYYVESWEKGTPRQYLQFVVIVFDAENTPDAAISNHQLRYPLAGIEEPPFEIGNAKYVFLGTEEPEVGRWVYFERNVRADFEELWGAVPEGFSKLRILFEVRWDGRQPQDAPSSADVYYDDLYVGRGE